jgi:hypothetical protein
LYKPVSNFAGKNIKDTKMKTYEVRQRNGKKGPGKLVTIVATEAEAKDIKTFLDGENSGLDTLISEQPAIVIETMDQFIARHDAVKAKSAKAAEALGKLTAEEKAALGL